MRKYCNIDKSAFRHGEYTGFAPRCSSYVWRVRKAGTHRWEARPLLTLPGPSCPTRLYADTLGQLSDLLGQVTDH